MGTYHRNTRAPNSSCDNDRRAPSSLVQRRETRVQKPVGIRVLNDCNLLCIKQFNTLLHRNHRRNRRTERNPCRDRRIDNPRRSPGQPRMICRHDIAVCRLVEQALGKRAEGALDGEVSVSRELGGRGDVDDAEAGHGGGVAVDGPCVGAAGVGGGGGRAELDEASVVEGVGVDAVGEAVHD
ncbi:hypothetical protein R3P38DRAFT_338474 [Favolaschia claudopus]|uniref:Uncharacterized protein n=1 Tax=Favolaschia claudopus TaxID=2862362 RepID=A0AAV9ZKP8_9AGAR